MMLFDKIKMNSFKTYFKYLCFDQNEFESYGLFFRRDYIRTYDKNDHTKLLEKDLFKYNVNFDDFINYAKNFFVINKEKFIKEINEEYLIRKKKDWKHTYADIWMMKS